MPKGKLEEIQYNRFYETVEKTINKLWTVKILLEKINRMLPSNLELTETGLRALIGKQYKYHTFKCSHAYMGKRTMYYIFRKGLPIE